MTAVVVDELAHSDNILARAHERSRDEVHAVFDTEEKVGLVPVGEVWHIEVDVRDVHTLAVLDYAAGDNGTYYAFLVAACHRKLDSAVVEEDSASGCDLLGEILI